MIELGAVQIALHAGVSPETAARVLQALRDEPDPLLVPDLAARHRPGRPNLHKLRIPDAHAASARDAWRCVTARLAGTPQVRISHDGGRLFPARYARPLPDDPPEQPRTIGVYDPGE